MSNTSPSSPKEKTPEQVRQEFLEMIHFNIRYWSSHSLEKSVEDRLKGLAFSILVAIDGNHAGLPAFILAPNPDSTDKSHHIKMNEDYFPEQITNIRCNISGSLQDALYGIPTPQLIEPDSNPYICMDCGQDGSSELECLHCHSNQVFNKYDNGWTCRVCKKELSSNYLSICSTKCQEEFIQFGEECFPSLPVSHPK
jgi:hypothetical protein